MCFVKVSNLQITLLLPSLLQKMMKKFGLTPLQPTYNNALQWTCRLYLRVATHTLSNFLVFDVCGLGLYLEKSASRVSLKGYPRRYSHDGVSKLTIYNIHNNLHILKCWCIKIDLYTLLHS